jgi:hypothetical protein
MLRGYTTVYILKKLQRSLLNPAAQMSDLVKTSLRIRQEVKNLVLSSFVCSYAGVTSEAVENKYRAFLNSSFLNNFYLFTGATLKKWFIQI